MKKFLCMMMALMLVCFSGIAEENAAVENEIIFLEEGTAMKLDLDGNGSMEDVLVKREGPEYEEYIALHITDSDGSHYSFDTFLSYSTNLMAVDMDMDGRLELFLCGDAYSVDLYTWCLNFDPDNGITALEFADVERGEIREGYTKYGYGEIIEIDGNEITLIGTQDVLGTWMASRDFVLRDGRFELADDGLWKMPYDSADPEVLEDISLCLTRELPVILADGSESTLSVGEKFLITASDKESIVHFRTMDGVEGSFKIEPDLEKGLGNLIGGLSEEEWFETIRYAD